ncbi:MAG: hypothetical protein RLZZ65_777 [Bacteroidota bacterium]|jgi:hypothetical protein
MKFILTICLLFLFGSCIEISDDLTLNNDGSGNLKYKINLSASKVKVNSMLALDSLHGKPVPSIEQISAKIKEFVKILDAQPGISNVLMEENYTDFIFKLSCDFTNVKLLQEGIKRSVEQISKEKLSLQQEENWITWDGTTLKRSIPGYISEEIKALKLDDEPSLKEGVYTSIARFERPVLRFENKLGTLSKNQQAVMVRTNTFALKENQSLLDNIIVLTPR